MNLKWLLQTNQHPKVTAFQNLVLNLKFGVFIVRYDKPAVVPSSFVLENANSNYIQADIYTRSLSTIVLQMDIMHRVVERNPALSCLPLKAVVY